MKRELDTFRAPAAHVHADLQRTPDQGWSSTIDDAWVFTIRQAEVSALNDTVEDEDWNLRPGQTAVERAAALDADADEALASEVVEVLRVRGSNGQRAPTTRDRR